MKLAIKPLITILIFTSGIYISAGQTPLNQRTWKSVATGMPEEWYGSEESKEVAENVLLYQRSVGGWPKNIPMHEPLSGAEKDNLLKKKDTLDAILDNDATTTEMKFMAKMYNKTKDESYKLSFNKGLSYILEAQYDNGGWPMFYPLKEGYFTHITFNDNAIVNILEILRDICDGRSLYVSVTSPDFVPLARPAYEKGIECILKTQIIVKGKQTVWCAQHDEITLLPAKARSYELPSFSGGESAGIIKLLMEIPDPSQAIINSVQGAIEWLDSHRIKNIRWDYFTNSEGLRDRRIIKDPAAGDMWARFYDLETGEAYVCDRDGIPKKTFEEIGHERRNGYSWYTNAPQQVLEKYPDWKAEFVK